MRTALVILPLALLASSCAAPLHSGGEEKAARCTASATKKEAARRAFQFALPLYETARTRQRMLSLSGADFNALIHRPALSRPDDRTITTPNSDTLYSTAWLDLSEGPVRFSIPAMGDRYHSVQLMHGFSDTFAILRNEGTVRREFLIAGPEWEGSASAGETLIRSPTRDAWLVARTFVEGSGDLAEARRLQAAYTIESDVPIEAELGEALPESPGASQFLAAVNEALARDPLPPSHAERLACFAPAGLVPGDRGSFAQLDPIMQRIWESNLPTFYREARQVFENAGTFRNGWRYPASNIAQFGTDDVYRSAIALGGLAALPKQEAFNSITTRDSAGDALDGRARYRLRIAPEVPVQAFWSLTLYQPDGSGRWFLYDNAIDRYAISSTGADLVRSEDGGISIDIAHAKPTGAGNWLPAPDGPFLLVFRAYRPKPSFTDGAFLLNPVERAND
ncbi:DUF1254 domain-containing protein [Altererythrobacter sp. GH1-8]|uniref:DUF1254 domain-containing protein n=1 Tax=Altererythrobacter sp. GH1-8 TaxID=3349333 RepID=UPI00374DD015